MRRGSVFGFVIATVASGLALAFPSASLAGSQSTIPWRDSTPNPTPTRSAEPGAIIGPNKHIKPNGTTKITSANPKTTGGQQIQTRVNCDLRLRGDLRLCAVVRKQNGAVYVRTFGTPLTLKITWFAPATATAGAFKQVNRYKA